MNKRVNNSWFVQKLIEMGACEVAIEYAKTHRTFPAAWNACEHSEWTCWLLRQIFPRYHCGNGYCGGDVTKTRRRFPADRVAKALRKWKA